MKDRRLHVELERWLTAEAASDEERAQRSFGALIAAVPRLAPGPGFAERVVRAAVPVAAPSVGPLAWGWKVALAVALVLAGMAAGSLPLLRLFPLEVPRLGVVAKGLSNIASWIGERLADGLVVWNVLARIGGAVGEAVATPEVATALLGSALLGGIALYTLHQLLTFERRIVR